MGVLNNRVLVRLFHTSFLIYMEQLHGNVVIDEKTGVRRTPLIMIFYK